MTTHSQAAVFNGVAGQLELTEIPIPILQAGEVLVRVLGCTLCGSDVHSVEGRRSVPIPTILGHEIVGTIAAFGSASPMHDLNGEPLRVGDRVTWAIVASCGQCFYCARGLPQKCLCAVKYGHEPFRPGRELLGGLADYCLLVANTAIVRLPEHLPLEVVCPASCATATIMAALEAAGELRDRRVCLMGTGMLGLTACAVARTNGALVVCVEPNPLRRERALQFGATRVCAVSELKEVTAEVTEQFGFDVVVELSGHPSAFETAWPLLRIGGTLVLVGSVFPTPAVPLLLEQVVRRQLTIRGVHNYAPRHLGMAIDFLARHHTDFPFAGLVTEWFPLAAISDAFKQSCNPNNIRVGVRQLTSEVTSTSDA
jgi:putative phosphonate catabolism associated alcohol dehydrogenase